MDADARARAEASAARQHGLITAGQAAAVGMTRSGVRHQLRTGRWSVERRRVYRVVGAPRTARQRLMAAVLDVGRGAVASHEAAAALHDLPGFTLARPHLSVLHATSPRVTDLRIVRTGHLPLEHCTVVDAIPCTTLARTLFDLCGTERAGRAERALDHALARRRVQLEELHRLTDAHADHGRDGSTLMRELLARRDPLYVAPESGLEARFVEIVAEMGLSQPERQVDLGDDDWIGRVDFLFRDQRVVVEVDGHAFHDSMTDRIRDRERDRRLHRMGLRVVRIADHELADSAGVVRRLRVALEPVAGVPATPDPLFGSEVVA